MDDKYKEAIKLKYEGKTYKEIAPIVGFTEDTLKQYFAVDGRLFIPYEEYAEKMNKQKLKVAQNIFARNVDSAASILLRALTKEMEYIEKAEAFNKTVSVDKWLRINYDKAVELAEKIMNRSGLTVVQKIETDDKRTGRTTYEQLVAELERAGIDTRSGLRKTATTIEQNRPLQN